MKHTADPSSSFRSSRFPLHPRGWLALLACGLCSGPLQAEAAHHVTVRVTVDSTNDYTKIGGSSEKSKHSHPIEQA